MITARLYSAADPGVAHSRAAQEFDFHPPAYASDRRHRGASCAISRSASCPCTRRMIPSAILRICLRCSWPRRLRRGVHNAAVAARAAPQRRSRPARRPRACVSDIYVAPARSRPGPRVIRAGIHAVIPGSAAAARRSGRVHAPQAPAHARCPCCRCGCRKPSINGAPRARSRSGGGRAHPHLSCLSMPIGTLAR